MIAVAAEAVSRLLFFELAHDPELLARLVVLYFEKGSAADPTANANAGREEGGSTEEDQEQEDEEMHKDAKAIGSSVRLSQVCMLGVGHMILRGMICMCVGYDLYVRRV